MVRPGWRPDEHTRLWVCRRNQLESQSKRAATARRLHSGDPLVMRMLIAEQNRTNELGKALVASTSEIGFARLRLDETALGFPDHLEDRRAADSVTENADTDVDLFGPRVRVAKRDQRQKRVALDGRKVGKSPCLLVGASEH